MFKIAATGTLSVTGPNGSPSGIVADTTVTVATGLTYLPAHMGYIETSSQAFQMPSFSFGLATGYMTDWQHQLVEVVNTNETKVYERWQTNLDRTAFTRTRRYYILKEVAI
jgi:hypothetical protein